MPGYPRPMQGYPNPMPGTPPTPFPEVGQGRDGSLTLTRVDTALVLGLEMTLKPSPYSIIMAKLDEFCVQLKSQGELVDARSHVHELAAALQEYVTANAAFPRGTIDRRPTGDRKIGYPPYERLSWMIEMLNSKSLGNGSYRNIHYTRNASWSEGENLLVAQMIVPEFLARTRKLDQPATVRYPNPKMTTPLAATHFVGMAGVGFDAADYRMDDKPVANKIGVFGYDRSTKLADIKAPDKTIALIQVKPEDAAPWIAGGGSTVRGVSDDLSDPSAVRSPVPCVPAGRRRSRWHRRGHGRRQGPLHPGDDQQQGLPRSVRDQRREAGQYRCDCSGDSAAGQRCRNQCGGAAASGRSEAGESGPDAGPWKVVD